MAMEPSRSRVFWALAASFLALGAAPAAACPPRDNDVFVGDVPINGTVIIDIECDGRPCLNEDVPADLPVFDQATGEELAGALVAVDASSPGSGVRITWRSHAPLVEGRTYEIGWSPDVREPLGTVDLSFEALPAARWRVDDVPARSQLDYAPDESEPVRLVVELDGRRAPIADQYTVRAAFWSSGEKPPPLAPVYARVAHRDFKRADAYCYRFEVRSLIDGKLRVHEACMSVAPR